MTVVEEFSPKPHLLVRELLGQSGILFNPQRLAIMMELYTASAVDFPQMVRDLEMTDGALATHLKALGSASFIRTKREQVDKRMRSTFVITREGISAVDRLLSVLCELRQELQR